MSQFRQITIPTAYKFGRQAPQTPPVNMMNVSYTKLTNITGNNVKNKNIAYIYSVGIVSCRNCDPVPMQTTKPIKKKHVDNHLGIMHKKENDLSLGDKSTNRGLISEDRSTEATLLFTIPRSCLSRLHRIYL